MFNPSIYGYSFGLCNLTSRLIRMEYRDLLKGILTFSLGIRACSDRS